MASRDRVKTQVRSKLRWGIVGIFALILLTLGYDFPQVLNKGIDGVNGAIHLGLPHIPEKPFSLGLDLKGGARLIYEADVNAIPDADRAGAVEGARDVIERRVNGLGVSEPEVQTTKVGETYRINVQLPGVTDVKSTIDMIGETPILEFREQNTVEPRDLTPEEQKKLDDFNKEAKDNAELALRAFKEKNDFEATVATYSQDEASKANNGYLGFIGKNTTYPELYEWAKGVAEGSVSDSLVKSAEGYNILKHGAARAGQPQVSASHILICYLGATKCDNATLTKDEAKKRAEELFNEANASNFAELARANSTEPGAKESGGDLGTFGKGEMVPAFDEAVFSAQVGQIIGPVETEFGFHVIYKKAEVATEEYEVSRVLVRTMSPLNILPSSEQWIATGLSGKQLERAEVVSSGTTGQVQVSLLFDSEGRDLFAKITEAHLDQPIAIFLDGQPISIPVVQSVIRDGRAVITGGFTLHDAQLLAQQLNAGALPVPVKLVSQETVGATLGAASLAASLRAGVIAIIIVMIFMILYYRLPGFVSVISLLLYALLTLALFKLIGVTLTLAGIAGFILSIGIAVDANVLIFERMKEELKSGKSLKSAVEEGFLRAWTSIRDGNVSTLITCALLISFGSSFVQGFAVVLGLGILVSLFTAIVITRVMLRFILPWFAVRGNRLFLGYTKEETPPETP